MYIAACVGTYLILFVYFVGLIIIYQLLSISIFIGYRADRGRLPTNAGQHSVFMSFHLFSFILNNQPLAARLFLELELLALLHTNAHLAPRWSSNEVRLR